MSLLLKIRRLDDVIIIDLNGRITIGDGTLTVRQKLQELLREGNRKFLINLDGVDYIDSSGLGELVALFASIRHEDDGQMKLLNLTHRVRDLLQITKLLTVFESFDDETEALKSMKG